MSLSGPQQSQNSQVSSSPLMFIPTPTVFNVISHLRDIGSRRPLPLQFDEEGHSIRPKIILEAGQGFK